jgi:hypothetical protein
MSDLTLDDETVLKLTKNLANISGIDKAAVDAFPGQLAASGAPVLDVTGSLTMYLIYGELKLTVNTDPYKKCKFEHTFWGGGGGHGEARGFMYTVYTEWDPFFRDVTSFHVQAATAPVGIFQVNFFRKDALPIGQFNAGAVGGLIVEGGNAGTWSC